MGDLSFDKAFDLFRLGYVIDKNLSPKTQESYDCCQRLLVRYFGDIPINKLDVHMVRQWRLWLSGWQKPDTVRNNAVCLRVVLKFLAEEDYEVMNYLKINVPKREKRKIDYLTGQEMVEFMEIARRRTRGYSELNRLRNIAIVNILMATGLRPGELCAFDRNTIRGGIFTVIGKSKDPRIGFVYEEVEESIKRYLAARTDCSPALFISNQNGNRITPEGIRRILKKICDNSGGRFEHVTPKTLRHSFGTMCVRNNMNLRLIADLMGHQDMNTTKIYTHYENPELMAEYHRVQQSERRRLAIQA